MREELTFISDNAINCLRINDSLNDETDSHFESIFNIFDEKTIKKLKQLLLKTQ